jgi:prepilin-type N-terminal cleavage/methylation domain-containing protein
MNHRATHLAAGLAPHVWPHPPRGASPAAKWSASRRGFTLIELLVVVAIIALLIAILLPSLAKAREQAKRVVCMANQSQIHKAMTLYSMSNKNELIICRARSVQKAFNPLGGGGGSSASDNKVDWIAALASVGLAIDKGEGYNGNYLPSPVWNCPSRNYQSQWEPGLNQLVVGYQYFGGITFWRNPWVTGKFPSRSPVDLDDARPSWALTADTTMKIDGVWGGGRASAYGDMPQHRDNDPWPVGGNQVFVDGSGAWIDFNRMTYNSSWGGDFSRLCYWYQQDLGAFNPPDDAYGKPGL